MLIFSVSFQLNVLLKRAAEWNFKGVGQIVSGTRVWRHSTSSRLPALLRASCRGACHEGDLPFLGQIAQARVKGFVLKKAESVFGTHFTFSYYQGFQWPTAWRVKVDPSRQDSRRICKAQWRVKWDRIMARTIMVGGTVYFSWIRNLMSYRIYFCVQLKS